MTIRTKATRDFRGNGVAPSSPYQVQVAASTGADFTASARPATVANPFTVEIMLHSDGTLEYVNRNDETVTLTELPAFVPLAFEAKAITANTNVKVTCWMAS